MPPEQKVSILFCAILLFSCLFGTEWRIPINLYPTSAETIYPGILYFGECDGATDYYDWGIDIAEPVPPPTGFSACFTIEDSLIQSLREDYRATVSPGTAASYLWQLAFRDESGESVSIAWEADSFPYEIAYPVYMQFIVSDTVPENSEWESAISITDIESIFISCSDKVFFRYRDFTRVYETTDNQSTFTINVFPNPVRTTCKIVYSLNPQRERSIIDAVSGIYSLTIFDNSGRTVYQNDAGLAGIVNVDMSLFPAGEYHLVFFDKHSQKTVYRKNLLLIK